MVAPCPAPCTGASSNKQQTTSPAPAAAAANSAAGPPATPHLPAAPALFTTPAPPSPLLFGTGTSVTPPPAPTPVAPPTTPGSASASKVPQQGPRPNVVVVLPHWMPPELKPPPPGWVPRLSLEQQWLFVCCFSRLFRACRLAFKATAALLHLPQPPRVFQVAPGWCTKLYGHACSGYLLVLAHLLMGLLGVVAAEVVPVVGAYMLATAALWTNLCTWVSCVLLSNPSNPATLLSFPMSPSRPPPCAVSSVCAVQA
jgi:hypothetical protein